MAIGGFIFEPEFRFFYRLREVCPTGRAISRHRGERSGIASARYAQGSIFYESLHCQMANGFTSGSSCYSFLQPLIPSKEEERCKCCLSADPSLGSWLRPNKGKCQHFNDVKAIRTRTYYKSEEYDITEPAAVDSMKAAEGSSEVVLASSWWEQVPKRWVNMSIAILPMSQEFNWNSATVGLIQSSFFWGYLLTQGVAMPAMNNILSKWIPVSERSRSLALVYSGMYLGSVTGLAVSPMLIHKFGWASVFYSFGSLGSIWFALWIKKASTCFFKLFFSVNSNSMYGS
ncbi:hypothetical protein NC651_031854 [Populus alba x Populus x berolinensis]|nr:hypothetical protein NC651_031854 [Populus alba x Populus x berolinensis]